MKRESGEVAPPQVAVARRQVTTWDGLGAQAWGIRAHLVALVLAVLLPMVVFGTVAAWEALRRHDALGEARLLDTARALSAAVDLQIGAHIGALQTLAASPGANPEAEPGRFLAHAQATAEVFGSWVVLYRRDGSQVFNTRVPSGTPLPGPGGAAGRGGGGVAITQAFDTGRPVVSDIAIGRVSGQPSAFVFVPVTRNGRAQAVIGMPLTPAELTATLRGQAAEGRGAVALTDGNGVFAARSRETEQVLGQQRPRRRDGPLGESGVLRGRSLTEGGAIRTAYHALSAAPGWHVWVNEPESSFSAARRGPMTALVGGAFLALVVGLAGAMVVARRLLRPVEALVARTEAVAASAAAPVEPVPVPQAGVAEFERLRRAVIAAEAALRRVQRIGRVGGFEVDLRPNAELRSQRSVEYQSLHGINAGWEGHAEWLARLHPADRARAEQRLFDAIAGKTPDGGYEQEYRIVLPDGEIRWIYARGEIERDAAGRPLRMVGAHVDVSALKSAEDALRDSAARLRLALEAARMGAWEMDLLTGEVKRSPRSVEILGLAPGEGDATLPLWSKRVHPEDRPAVHEALNAVREGRDLSYCVQFRFLRPDDRWVWVESHGQGSRPDPMTGKPTLLIGTTLDITDRKEAEERQAVLVHELDHRAKNTLAVVQAALRLTPRNDVAAYARAVEGRVAALSRAHTLLAKGRWSGADLRTVAQEALTPFQPAGGTGPAVTLDGPSLPLAPAAVQALSMALHELATNAAKHGALSTPGGRLSLDWTIEDGVLTLHWRERGGPPVVAVPDRKGFGATLITTTMTRQLGGQVRSDWRPEGLDWEARLPVDRLVPGHDPVEPLTAAEEGPGPQPAA